MTSGIKIAGVAAGAAVVGAAAYRIARNTRFSKWGLLMLGVRVAVDLGEAWQEKRLRARLHKQIHAHLYDSAQLPVNLK